MAGYPLGTDAFGRSVLSLLIVGTRVSRLLVGLTATVGAVFLGATVGVVSGYYGGTKIDTVLSALTDWFLVIPWLVLAIVLAAILGADADQRDPRDRGDLVGDDRAPRAARRR